jgi:TonB family protein
MSTTIAMLLVELAVKSTTLIGAIWVISALPRRLSASERHGLWACAILGLLALPAAVLLAPRVEIAVPGIAAALEAGRGAVTDPASGASAANDTASVVTRAAAADEARRQRPAAGPANDAARSGGAGGAVRTPGAAALLTGAYASVALLLLAHLAIAMLQVSRSLRRLEPARNRQALGLLDEIRGRAGVRRSVALKLSRNDVTPWAWGWRHPVIVIPTTFAQWPPSAQRNALLHEVSHIKRLDFITALLGYVCRALYWFHPLVWLAIRRLNHEAERACDDSVVLAGGRRSAYAAQLLELAANIQRGRGDRILSCAMAKPSSISYRIFPLLHTGIRRTAMGRAKTVAALSLVAALTLPVGALKSQDDTATFESFEFTALVERGAANSDELGAIVMALLANGREDDAAVALASFIWPHSYGAAARAAAIQERPERDCEFCSSVLATEGTRAPHAALPALLSAFDAIERRAVEAGDGNPLIRIATLAGHAAASPSQSREGRGIWYLHEGFRLGNLTDGSKMQAVAFLAAIHWYEPATALVEQLRQDTSSALHDSPELQQWSRYLGARLTLMNKAGARLLAANDPTAVDLDGEYLPAFRVAPVYPAEAADAELEGHVIVEFTVSERGRPENVTVIQSSDPVFEQPAIQAASQFRYAPRVVGGVAIEVQGVENLFTFALQPEH